MNIRFDEELLKSFLVITGFLEGLDEQSQLEVAEVVCHFFSTISS